MKRPYILQDKNYALGNFINVTPVAKYYFEQYHEPIDVHFETEYVKACYQTSPYIRIIQERPEHAPLASSSIVCRKNDQRDYVFAFEKVTGIKYDVKYKPFIDEPEGPRNPYQYAVIVNGSGSDVKTYVDGKNPGQEIYLEAIEQCIMRGIMPVFTGSAQDALRNEAVRLACDRSHIGDIRKSLHLIRNADLVIGNDTGLVHAAGCFDKRMLVYWKDTPKIRVQNSGTNTMYSYSGCWSDDTKNFIKSL